MSKPPRDVVPVTKELIARVCADPDIWPGVKMAILLGFNGMLRVGEYTARRVKGAFDPRFTILRSDLRWDAAARAFVHRIKRSKSDPFFMGPQFHFMETPGDSHCPVANLRVYMTWFDTQFPAASPLLRRPNGQYVVPADIFFALRKHSAACGIPPAQVMTHSLRYGGAFALAEAGLSLEDIIARGRWNGRDAHVMARKYSRFSVSRMRRVADGLRIDDQPSAQPFINRG